MLFLKKEIRQELEQYSEEYLQGLTSSETNEADEAAETEEVGGTSRVGGMAGAPEEDEWDD